ncbi:MAG: ATP synthase subunit I [Cyanobacteria bacterium P01_H01_bin.15]
MTEGQFPAEILDESPETVNAELETIDDSMQEYYRLRNNLLLGTALLSSIAFASVWLFYSLNTALNYLLGACFSVVYLRMLAKAVERIDTQKRRFGYSRIGLFIGLMIVATRWQQLDVIPIFLGFLTYKAAVILYVLQSVLSDATESRS